MFPSYRNQSIDLLWKSTDWFPYDVNIGILKGLRILSFIPQRQRIQMDFMLDTIKFFIHTKHNRDNADSGVTPFKLHTKSAPQTTKSHTLSISSYMQCSMETFHPFWTMQQYNSKACICLANFVTNFESVLN